MPMPDANAHTSKLFTEVEAAKVVNCSPRTLQKWRGTGKGPPFVRVTSRCIRYRAEDLEAFIESRVRTSTSDHRQGRTELES